jgi:cation diffusion facilitator family transporter
LLNGNAAYDGAAANREKEHAAITSVLAAVGLTVMKLVVGLATGSLGILSEAAHSGLDLIAAVITAVAVRIAGRPADRQHNYGHGKVEHFSALIEVLLLLVTCVWIIAEALRRLVARDYAVEATWWGFLMMAVSIAVDYNRSRQLSNVARKYNSQALEADALHFRSDIWSSAVVIVGLVLVKLGFPMGDPLAALGVACLVVVVSLRLAKRTIDALLDTAPQGLAATVQETLNSTAGVVYCPRVRARQAGGVTFVDAQVAVASDLPLEKVNSILSKAENAVRELVPGVDLVLCPVPAKLDGKR